MGEYTTFVRPVIDRVRETNVCGFGRRQMEGDGFVIVREDSRPLIQVFSTINVIRTSQRNAGTQYLLDGNMSRAFALSC